MYEQLPDELHNAIISKLRYLDVLPLRQVSRRFYRLVELENWPEDDKRALVKEAQLYMRHNLSYGDHRTLITLTDGYACYFCYTVKPRSAFSQTQIRSREAKNNHHYDHRFCIAGGIEKNSDIGTRERKKKYYAPRQFLNVTTHPAILLFYGVESHRSTKVDLFVCPRCKDACTYTVLSASVFCERYGEARQALEDSGSKKAVVKYSSSRSSSQPRDIRCESCKEVNEVLPPRGPYACPGCEARICGRCARNLDEAGLKKCGCVWKGRAGGFVKLVKETMGEYVGLKELFGYVRDFESREVLTGEVDLSVLFGMEDAS